MADPLRQAQALLSRDPRLGGFEVRSHGDGLTVSAVADVDWFAEERSRRKAAVTERMLRQWRFIYDRSYRSDQGVREPNFDVWTSAFTRRPIPQDRMQAWLGGVLRQVRSVPHERVLDVGCGAGLVLAALAPESRLYEAVDPSSEAITSLGAWIATQQGLDHVRLAEGGAHGLRNRTGGAIDLVIMNSVVQYFPEADYLSEAIGAAVEQAANRGAIFIGDVRAPSLLPMRALCVAASLSDPGARVAEVAAEAEVILAADRELAVDPAFFLAITEGQPRITRVRFALKPSEADHDLSGYRFDALLQMDAARAPAAPISEAKTLAPLLGELREKEPLRLAALGLLNNRLTADAALAKMLKTAAPNARLDAQKAAARSSQAFGLEPENLAEAVAEIGYAAEFRLSPGASDGRFDALLTREGEEAQWPATSRPPLLTNDPIGAELLGDLGRELVLALQTLGREVSVSVARPEASA